MSTSQTTPIHSYLLIFSKQTVALPLQGEGKTGKTGDEAEASSALGNGSSTVKFQGGLSGHSNIVNGRSHGNDISLGSGRDDGGLGIVVNERRGGEHIGDLNGGGGNVGNRGLDGNLGGGNQGGLVSIVVVVAAGTGALVRRGAGLVGLSLGLEGGGAGLESVGVDLLDVFSGASALAQARDDALGDDGGCGVGARAVGVGEAAVGLADGSDEAGELLTC